MDRSCNVNSDRTLHNALLNWEKMGYSMDDLSKYANHHSIQFGKPGNLTNLINEALNKSIIDRHLAQTDILTDGECNALIEFPSCPKELKVHLENHLPTVGKNFTPIRKLGQGGMGAVFEMLEHASGSSVAIKFLIDPSPEMILGFENEFRMLTGLFHRNLIHLYKFYNENDNFCFAMEYIDGPEISKWVKPLTSYQKGLSTEAVGKIRDAFFHIAEGVQVLHRCKMLHRDLKPSNILYETGSERPVILDFGLISSFADRIGETIYHEPDFAGTFSYMAPEQMSGDKLSGAADWYSFGVVLYEMLSGKRAFQGNYTTISEKKADWAIDKLPEYVPCQVAKLCQQLLHPDPKARPEYSEIAETLVPGAPLYSPGFNNYFPDTGVFGRASELSILEQIARQAKPNEPGVVMVNGPSGMGKSSLIKEFFRILSFRAKDDFILLSGRCYEQESRAYKGFDQIISRLSGILSTIPREDLEKILPRDFCLLSEGFHLLKDRSFQILSEGQHVDVPLAKRRSMYAAFRELMKNVAEDRTIIIFLDDLQWCDEDGMALLDFLLHSKETPVKLIITGTYRSKEGGRNQLLQKFLEKTRKTARVKLTELALGELDEESLLKISQTIIGDNHPLTEAIVEQAQGNPFFLTQLAVAVNEGAEVANLQSILRGRISDLDKSERNLLEILAVAGRPISKKLAFEAAGLRGGLKLESNLAASHLIQTTVSDAQDSFEAWHDRIRETVLAGLKDSQLQTRHLQLAEILEFNHSTDYEALGRHNHMAGRSEKGAVYYDKAGDASAKSFGFDQSARMYRNSLICSKNDRARNLAIRRKLAEALANAGRGLEAAIEFGKVASRLADKPEQLKWKKREAYQYMISGHLDEGLSVFREVLDYANIKYPGSQFESLLSTLAQTLLIRVTGIPKPDPKSLAPARGQQADRIDTLWMTGCGLGHVDVFRASDFHLRALRLSIKANDPARISRSLALHSLYYGFSGIKNWHRTNQLLELTKQYSETVNDIYSRALYKMAKSGTFMLAAKFQQAVTNAKDAERLFKRQVEGVTWEIDTVRVYHTYSLLSMGDLNELRSIAARFTNDAEEKGDLYSSTNMRSYITPILLTFDDQPEAALDVRREAVGKWSDSDFFAQHMCGMLSFAEAMLYLGRPDEVLDFFGKNWSSYKKALYHKIKYPHSVVLNTRARAHILAWVKNKNPAHLKAALRDSRSIYKEGTPHGHGLAQSLQACVSLAEGNIAQSEELLKRAITNFERAHMSMHAAAARDSISATSNWSNEIDTATSQPWWNENSIPRPEKLRRSLIPLPEIR